MTDLGDTSAENNSSAILQLEVDDRRILFTGDAGIAGLTHVADLLDAVGVGPETLHFFQVPHHGSRDNLGPTILNRLVGEPGSRPDGSLVSLVSAAKRGAPNHPSRRITNSLYRRSGELVVTRGRSICEYHHAPPRENWTSVQREPFYEDIDE